MSSNGSEVHSVQTGSACHEHTVNLRNRLNLLNLLNPLNPLNRQS